MFLFLLVGTILVYNMKNEPRFSLSPQTADELRSADVSECHGTQIHCVVCAVSCLGTQRVNNLPLHKCNVAVMLGWKKCDVTCLKVHVYNKAI